MMPNTPRNLPADIGLAAMFKETLSSRVARLTAALEAANEEIAQASTEGRWHDAAHKASDLAEAVGVVEAAMFVVGF